MSATVQVPRLKIAVVGCGQIADSHITEIHKIPEAQLVAVCDLNEIMAEQAAVRLGVPRHYTDLQQLLSEQRPDVVHVTTPPQSHLAIGKLCLELGAHVYIEKPFTINGAEAEELVACASRFGRQVCVGHNYMWDAAALEAKRMASDGQLGEIRHVESTYAYDLDGHFGKLLLDRPEHWVHGLPGRLTQNVAVNALYKLTDFIPDANVQVQASGFKWRRQRFGDRRDNFNDELRVFLKGQDCTGTLLFSSHIRPMLHSLHVFGSRASVHIDWHARSVTADVVSALPGALGRLALPFRRTRQQFRHSMQNTTRFIKAQLQYNDGMNTLFRAFYRAIREGLPSPIPMSEAVRVTRVMDEIIRQTESTGSES